MDEGLGGEGHEFILGMSRMTHDLETLAARAAAATLRAKELAKHIAHSRDRARELIAERRTYHFMQADRTINYPQDFPDHHPLRLPFHGQADESQVVDEG